MARISRADPVGGGEEYADQGRMVSARRKLRLDFQISPCLWVRCRWVGCGCDRIGRLVGYRGPLAVRAAVSFGFCFVQPFGMGV